jgi:hypothetical protein
MPLSCRHPLKRVGDAIGDAVKYDLIGLAREVDNGCPCPNKYIKVTGNTMPQACNRQAMHNSRMRKPGRHEVFCSLLLCCLLSSLVTHNLQQVLKRCSPYQLTGQLCTHLHP